MNTGNEIAILYLTKQGREVAEKLRLFYPTARVNRLNKEDLPSYWSEYKGLIFVMATQIVVRTIAPYLKDKKTDPAVVVVDEKGENVISLLSGHIGGANSLTSEIAAYLSAHPVVTTATDLKGLPAIDLWAKEMGLLIDNWGLLSRITGRLLEKGRLNIYIDRDVQGYLSDLPAEYIVVESPINADVLITSRLNVYKGCEEATTAKAQLYIRPKNLVIGIGCNSNTPQSEIEEAVKETLKEYNLSFLSLKALATINKKADEEGIKEFVKKHSLELVAFSADELNRVKGIEGSEVVLKATGAVAVAEPAALLASGAGNLLVPKQKRGNVTVAVACMSAERLKQDRIGRGKKGEIFVVGTGPGDLEHLTPYALKAIRSSDVVVGYGPYLELISDVIQDKETFSTGMTREIDRCRKAVELAMEGKKVSVVSGGDPGVYAMAGLVFEILRADSSMNNMAEEIPVEVIPGISALNACAARLGAPLMHDFACISLSDRLTPWELIEERLEAAARADFVIVIYNPKSRGRPEHINRAREIILNYRSEETPVGIVRAAMRADEKVVITTLGDMLSHDIDMKTTVIIGNSNTFVWNNRMITPRGYEKKGFHIES